MKTKNMLLAAALIGAAASVSAQTYAVWPPAEEGQTQIPVEFNWWWNAGNDVVEIDGINATKIYSADGSGSASCGWITLASSAFDFAVLADMDLVLDARIDGPGAWKIRLTANGPEADAAIDLAADASFHNLRYNLRETFPTIAEAWAAGVTSPNNDHVVFPFALVGEGIDATSAIYFTNCRYEASKPQPAIEATVGNVTETSAVLDYTVTFPDGYTSTSVTVNGTAADASGQLTLTGLTPNTAYEYTIVATGVYAGETLSKSKTVSFKTLREAGTNPVWYGLTEIPGFTAEYSITYNNDKTLTVEAEITTEKETPVADRNFHIFIGGDEWLKLYDDGTGVLTGTTNSQFEEGATITWEWYLPYAGGVYQKADTYVVGSENEAPLAVRIKASVEAITFESAEIHYTVTCPEAYVVYYRIGDGDIVVTTENPIVLTHLTEKTEYSVEIYAATVEGLESTHQTLTFKTPAKDAVDLVYADLFKAELKNAFLPGEDESARRSFYVTIPWSVVYRTDGTAVYAADLSSIEAVVGLVPQIYWNGFQTLTKNAASGMYEYEFGVQELDAVTAISHYFAYAGGVVDSRTPYTNWGMEKEAPVLGDASALIFSASKTAVLVDEVVNLTAVATDAAGYYLPADGVEFSCDNTNALFSGSTVRFINQKGAFTVKAAVDGLEATTEIRVIASPEAENVLAGLKGVTNENYIQAGSVDFVTDTDRNSQLEWKCDETEEHYLVFDLASGDDSTAGKYIEAVEVYFEGAYATEFSVTLSSAAPAELSTASGVRGRAAAASDAVFTNTGNDVQHYFTQDPTETHRYVTLRTTKALNTGWGIKVRDMKVYATDELPSTATTGVEAVTVEGTDADMPVEYYNLNGMRVANPGTGLYIRRQGSSVSKVMIR